MIRAQGLVFLTCVVFTSATVNTAAVMFCDRSAETVEISVLGGSYARTCFSCFFGCLTQARAPGHASGPAPTGGLQRRRRPTAGSTALMAGGPWRSRFEAVSDCWFRHPGFLLGPRPTNSNFCFLFSAHVSHVCYFGAQG
jgi:hypothetical protein